MTPLKRLIFALAFLAAALLIGIGLYWVFFRGAPLPEGAPGEAPGARVTGLPTAAPGTPGVPGGAPGALTPGALPVASPIAQGGPTKVTTLTLGAVRGAVLSGDGATVAYYDRSDNRFYRIGPDGKATLLSDEQFFSVENVAWSPDAGRAILEYPDGANIAVDFERGTKTTLPKHWEDFDFSPQGTQIITKSIGVSTENRWLITSEMDGSRTHILAPLGDNADKVTVAWSPSDEVVGFSATGDALGLDTTEVFAIGKQDENFKSLIVEGRDFRPLWSPDGERILYSAAGERSGWRPALWMTSGRGSTMGDGRRSIGLATWADKCVFSDAVTAYCAVPENLPEGYGLQPNLRRELMDRVFRIHLDNGSVNLIGAPEEATSMEQLAVSRDGKYLFYVDMRTSQLKQMQLR